MSRTSAAINTELDIYFPHLSDCIFLFLNHQVNIYGFGCFDVYAQVIGALGLFLREVDYSARHGLGLITLIAIFVHCLPEVACMDIEYFVVSMLKNTAYTYTGFS